VLQRRSTDGRSSGRTVDLANRPGDPGSWRQPARPWPDLYMGAWPS